MSTKPAPLTTARVLEAADRLEEFTDGGMVEDCCPSLLGVSDDLDTAIRACREAANRGALAPAAS